MPLSSFNQGNASCTKNGVGRICCGTTTNDLCATKATVCPTPRSKCSGIPGYYKIKNQCSNRTVSFQAEKCTDGTWSATYMQVGTGTCFSDPCIVSPGSFKGSDYRCLSKLSGNDTCCYSQAGQCFAGTGPSGINPNTKCNYN